MDYWVQTTGEITGNGFRTDVNTVAPTTWAFDGSNTTRDLSYQLINVTGPEPASLLLLTLGILIGGFLPYRRRA